MEFSLEFKLGNAAYMDDPDADDGRVSGRAVSDTLRAVAAAVEELTLAPHDMPLIGTVRDPENGFRVGAYRFWR